MGKVFDTIESSTHDVANDYHNSPIGKTIGEITSGTKDAFDLGTSAVILSLSKAWIGIGMVKPATSELQSDPEWLQNRLILPTKAEGSSGQPIDRFNYRELYSLQLGDYFMPLSQTFTLRAKKRLNISALVDGPDIIQQTRKEAKTIDCVLRLTLRENQDNLQILESGDNVDPTTDQQVKIATLAKFLSEFYEKDAIFAIKNQTVNETFGVQYVFMSEYRFIPRVGMKTFTFEFSLMEVLYGENAVTFNLREIDADAGTY